MDFKTKNKIVKIISKLFIFKFLKYGFRDKFYYYGETTYQKTHRLYDIGDYSYIGHNTTIKNLKTKIGKFCSISSNVSIGVSQSPTNCLSTHPFIYSSEQAGLFEDIQVSEETQVKWDYDKQLLKPITIGNDVWIGLNAIIMDGITIGDGAIIGAGAVVTHDVEPYAIVGGVPAKVIRYRFSSEIIKELLELKWWDCPKEFIENELPFDNIEMCIRKLKEYNSQNSLLINISGGVCSLNALLSLLLRGVCYG